MKSVTKLKSSPPEAAILQRIRSAYAEMAACQAVAVNKALYLGALLIEAKQTVVHGDFLEWRRNAVPELSDDRAERYMQAAANTLKQVTLPVIDLPISAVINTPAEDLPSDAAREAQQLIFDFTKDKTIKDCLASVFVDGDEPHRITRAGNGKKLGGTKGEDRKDWPKFIGQKLSDVAAHLKHWASFSPAQVEVVLSKLSQIVVKWPTPVLAHLKKVITEELKSR